MNRFGDGLNRTTDGYSGRIEKLGKQHILMSGDDGQRLLVFCPLNPLRQASPGFCSGCYS